ncbi:MAG TPA: response regulator transcription factor [Candidatus Avipropionibacterium avicola]|uniref:Response regulator transcription factor n=1 Tax=Candidatus Avipropionibacterium avicola TaxID=2840701 RepID=A0A9D1KMD5_9ACTN|nr:response regulator transcription factor [Candidatus Avipropionibacterium avicola]
MIRVLVVDDQELLRRGLRLLLETVDDIEVVDEAADGQEALGRIEHSRPDVVLADARMPVLDGEGLVAACAERHPGLPVLVLSTFDDAEVVRAVHLAGAAGFLLKDVSTDTLADGIRAVRSGGLVLDPRVARLVASPPQEADPLAELTAAERSVAERVARGMSNAEIAADLSLAEGTVKNTVSALFRKLGVRDRTALALTVSRAAG